MIVLPPTSKTAFDAINVSLQFNADDAIISEVRKKVDTPQVGGKVIITDTILHPAQGGPPDEQESLELYSGRVQIKEGKVTI